MRYCESLDIAELAIHLDITANLMIVSSVSFFIDAIDKEDHPKGKTEEILIISFVT